jgi:hypothetical protein
MLLRPVPIRGNVPLAAAFLKLFAQGKGLKLADVVSQELLRRNKELAARLRGVRSEVKAVLDDQAKERKALEGKTVEGTAQLLGAYRNAALARPRALRKGSQW